MLARDASIVRWAQAESANATAEQPIPVKITVRMTPVSIWPKPSTITNGMQTSGDDRELDRGEPEDVEAVREHPGPHVPAAEERPR